MPAALTLSALRAHDPHGGRGPSHAQRWRCPFCGGRERALSLNEPQGLWKCWRGSCGLSGRLGDLPRFDAREVERRRQEVEREREAHRRKLFASARLHRLRGTLGAAYLARRGIPLHIAQRAGVVWCPWFLGHPAVVFRVRDGAGRVVALQGRYLHTDDPDEKCRSMGDISAGMFETPGAWDGDITLCEGPLDALSLACMGRPALASCGTSLPVWLPEAVAGRMVWLATDNDPMPNPKTGRFAGDEIAERWGAMLEGHAARVERLRPTRGKDWNDEWLCA